MGCCVSREENRAKHDPHFPCISKSPPLLDEEETVKEVLSETPQPQSRPKPNSGPINNVGPDPGPDPDPDPDPEVMQILKPTYTKPNTVIRQKHLPINPIKSPGSGRVPEPEEVSDVSEMCSLSESISTATLREDEHHGAHNNDGSEVVQRVYKHKPQQQGQNSNFTHGSNRGRVSPGRLRSDPSPTRARNPGPGPGPGRVGRRSRSPVTRSNNVGQSPSRRRAGPSPGRVRMVSGPDRENEGKKMEEVNERRRGINDNDNENEWDGPNESLDNPLVSLECFIFL